MKRYLHIIKNIAPLICIILLIIYLFIPVLFPPPGQMLYGGDIYDAYFFWKSYLRESIREGIIPFWNPYNFSGTPFLAHPNINIFYPPNWLFIIIPVEYSFAYYLLIHLIVAATTMYWLGREYVDKWGATAAAIVYSLSGYFSARIYAGHPEYIDTAAWMPLAFGLTRRALINPNRKNIFFSFLGLSILLLSGNELFFLFTLELLLLYLVYLLIKQIIKRNQDGKLIVVSGIRMMLIILISIILALGLTAVEILPRFQFLRLSLRSSGISYDLASSGSLPISALRLFIQPFFYGGVSNYHGPWPNLSEYTYYVGVVPITSILFFIVYFIIAQFFKLPKFDSEIWFFFLLVIPFFLLISLGNNTNPNIYEVLWRFIPFYKSLRFPVRHLFVVVFSLSIVTGIIIGNIKNRLIKLSILIILTIDLLLFDKHFIRTTPIPTSTFDQRLISTLTNDKSLFRLLPDFAVVSKVRRDLDFGAASMYKIQTTSDYNSMILADYYHFIDLLNKSSTSSVAYYNVEIPPPNPWSPLVDFLNVKYILSDKNFDAIGKEKEGKFKLVLEGERYKLYQNLTYKPRFFLVGKSQILPKTQELDRVVLKGDVDLEQVILFTKKDLKDFSNIAIDCKEKEVGLVDIISYTPNRVVLKVKATCNSFLSSSEVYYPGWKAKIDGRSTPVYKSNVAFRSIYVPKGEHSVEFYYYPGIYYLGGGISFLWVVLFVFSLFFGKKLKKDLHI